MEKINYDWGVNDTFGKLCNAKMTFIVNRAAEFNSQKYPNLYSVIKDTSVGNVAYELLNILATAKGVKVYAPYSLKRCRFYHKDGAVKPVLFYKIRSQKTGSLILDCSSTCDNEYSTKYPQVFSGFNQEEIESIARELYGWVEGKAEYRLKRKVYERLAKEEIRKEEESKKCQK